MELSDVDPNSLEAKMAAAFSQVNDATAITGLATDPVTREAWERAAEVAKQDRLDRIKNAMTVAANHQADLPENGKWVVDQIMRHLLGVDYEAWEKPEGWSAGAAP